MRSKIPLSPSILDRFTWFFFKNRLEFPREYHELFKSKIKCRLQVLLWPRSQSRIFCRPPILLFLNGFGSNFQEMSLISCWSTYPKLRSINQSIKKILALKWPFFWQAKNIWGRFFLYPPGMPFMQKKNFEKFFWGGIFCPPPPLPIHTLSWVQ